MENTGQPTARCPATRGPSVMVGGPGLGSRMGVLFSEPDIRGMLLGLVHELGQAAALDGPNVLTDVSGSGHADDS